ncbi:MAG: hypothetical protein AB1742_05345 [bacterium]
MMLIGEFYKEKILSLPKKALMEMELPYGSEPSRVEQDLFGWNLRVGKELIECRSEEEARFLKVFQDIGYRDVMIPKSLDYIKELISELEDLRAGMDEVIDYYVECLISLKKRERVRQMVYSRIRSCE